MSDLKDTRVSGLRVHHLEKLIRKVIESGRTADEDTGTGHGSLVIVVSKTLVQSCVIHYRVGNVEGTLGGELSCCCLVYCSSPVHVI